jgi:hypothetical protein
MSVKNPKVVDMVTMFMCVHAHRNGFPFNSKELILNFVELAEKIIDAVPGGEDRDEKLPLL